MIKFTPSLQLEFNFKEAFSNNVIKEILLDPKADYEFLKREMGKIQIGSF